MSPDRTSVATKPATIPLSAFDMAAFLAWLFRPDRFISYRTDGRDLSEFDRYGAVPLQSMPNVAERRPLVRAACYLRSARCGRRPSRLIPRTACLGQRTGLSESPIKEAPFFTDVLFAALAANRAKWSFRTSSPEALAAASDRYTGAENFTG